MPWKPVLTGPLAQHSRDAALAIADALEEDAGEPQVPSLAHGHAGIALLHGYLAAATGDERAASRAEDRLSRAIDAASEQTLSAGFFVGLPGIAWANFHLEELLTGEAPPPDLNEEVDEWVAEIVRTTPWPGKYDLIYGLAGLGRYALDHPDRAFARQVLGSIVARLDEMATVLPEGITWLSDPALLRPALAEVYPQGHFDQGTAHGVAGVISLLSRAWTGGLVPDTARRLLAGAVDWLLAHKRSGDGSTFSYFVLPAGGSGAAGESCRSAWCYGDPGIAAALFSAARALGRPAWEREAVSIALRDCARPLEDTGVVDAELCHGAAGLGHLYNRLYQAAGEPELARVAQVWFERALEMRQSGHGIAGYVNWWPEVAEWHADPGLLTGAAGIGLALLAATSDLEPRWDRLLMLDMPPAEL